MPSGLGRSGWYLWIAIVLAVAGIFLTAPPSQQDSPIPSVYASGSGGGRAAYLLLRNLHYDVRVWEQQPAALPSTKNAVLILAEPSEPPGKGDVEALRHFVEAGGRVLFSGGNVKMFFPSAEVSEPVIGIDWKEFSANLPSAISRNANLIVIRPEVYWTASPASQIALYGGPSNTAVVSWRIGSGEVIWWAGATPLTNAGISRAGNLNLFLNSIGSGALIYWDEYFHGERASLYSYVQKTPVVWAGVQILIVALAIVFTFSRRSGPIVAPPAVSRLSPLEFVDTMGALYRHAGASTVPVDVSRRHLRLELTRRLGLPSATPDPDLARAAADRLGFDRASLADTLHRSTESVFARKPSAREALDLVQKLERFNAQLAMPKIKFEEKN